MSRHPTASNDVASRATAGKPSPRSRGRRGGAQERAAWTFVLPFLVLFAAVYAAPIVFAVGQSLFRRQSSGLGFGPLTTSFAGLANYGTVLSDQAFWAGVGRIALFGAVQVSVMIGIALILALVLDSASARYFGGFRLIYFLPYAIPGVIAAILWAYLYSPQLSPIVQSLRGFGLPIDFLASGTVLWSIANIVTWSWVGFNTLIFLSALHAVPRDLYDAARADGAGALAVAVYIKIPHLRAAVVLVGTLSIIGTMQIFSEPQVLRSLSDGVSSDYVPMMYALRAAYTNNNPEVGATASVVIAVLAGVLSAAYYRLTSRTDS